MLATLALFYLAWEFNTFPGDRQALLDFQSLETNWLNESMLAISRLGWTPIAVTLVLVTASSLLVLHRRVDALIMVLGLATVYAGNSLKALVDRPRPDYLLEGPVPSNMSFPSGHSIFAMVFCGLLIYLAEELIRPPLIRRSVQAGLVLLILAIGASRVYLGVHWPSDVIGGYLFGGMAVVGLIWLRNRLVNYRR